MALDTLSTFTTHEFLPMRLAARAQVSEARLRSQLPNGKWTVDIWRDAVIPGLIAEIRGFVAAKKESVTVRYPADWWQAVKLRFAPQWFLGQWPVLYREVVVDARLMFQNFPAPSEWGRSIKWVEQSNGSIGAGCDWESPLEEPGYGAGV